MQTNLIGAPGTPSSSISAPHQHSSSSSSDTHSRVSNLTVLYVTAASFTIFVVAEIIGAVASNSLSLLGDASAMSVDVFTYFTNMYAERVKARGEKLSRRANYVMEVCIPTFSVTALLAITGWITSDALNIVIHGDNGEDVDVYFLYGFAAGNFLVDVLSTTMFYMRGKAVFSQPHEDIKIPLDFASPDILSNLDPDVPTEPHEVYVTSRMERLSSATSPERSVAGGKKKSNLNMLSAFTHVGGDTMRTFAVFLAAVIATATDVSGSTCDAWAAVVVTFTILVCVLPLIREIYKAHFRIMAERY